MPVFIDQPKTNISYTAQAWQVSSMKFQKNSFIRSRNRDEKILYSEIKVPFATDRSEPTLQYL